jgi:hypothetical protein
VRSVPVLTVAHDGGDCQSGSVVMPNKIASFVIASRVNSIKRVALWTSTKFKHSACEVLESLEVHLDADPPVPAIRLAVRVVALLAKVLIFPRYR